MTNTGIEAFLAVCRRKSVSKAAEELFISQSSLSTRLRTLEDELGCKLFSRGKGSRELSLTREGQVFLGLATQYRSLIKRMENVGKAPVEEHITVTVIGTVGNYVLTPVFENFTRAFPHVRLGVEVAGAEYACIHLIKGTSDIAFSTANVQTDQIFSVPFMSDPFVVIAPEDTDLCDPVPLSSLSVADEIYYSFCAEQEYWHRGVFGSDAAPKITIDLSGQLRLFVSTPGSWAVAPKTVAAALCATPGVKMLRPGFYIPDRVVYILRNRENADSEPIRSFLSVLRETLSNEDVTLLLP
ncbi:MAG: LysR family transcriptional regulator [Clostridia bacterium]|nr:LysR family transcriptional regulator [Clostridia bacterium]